MMQGAGMGWMVLVVVVWLGAIAAAVGLTVHYVRAGTPARTRLPSPLEILERRFAAGELTVAEFDEARARIRERELDR